MVRVAEWGEFYINKNKKNMYIVYKSGSGEVYRTGKYHLAENRLIELSGF